MLAVYSVRLVSSVLSLPYRANIKNSIGEDALANLSIEKTEGGTITGHVRIRSKTQGIALSLGDRITMGGAYSRYDKSTATNFVPMLAAQKTQKPSV